MKKIFLNAYLMFDGNCREAMAFYQSLFGGTLKTMTFGEMDNSCPEAMRDSIMHASIMGGEVELLGCDNPDPKPHGSANVSLALSGANEEHLTQLFHELGKDGKVVVPWKNKSGEMFSV